MSLPYDMPYDLYKFCELNPTKRVVFLLHSSIVLAQEEEIKDILAKRNCMVLKDCLYELKFLEKHGNNKGFRNHAHLVLSKVDNSVGWTTSDVWNSPDKFKSCYKIDIPVYVFFEPASAESFVRHMSNRSDFYYLNYDPFIRMKQDQKNKDLLYSCIPQPTTTQFKRKCVPITKTGAAVKLHPESILELLDVQTKQAQKELRFKDLKKITGGGEGDIYETPSMTGMVIKIYKNIPCSEKITKLRWLYATKNSMPNCVQPVYLIYNNGRCVGYVMRKIEGTPFLLFQRQIDSLPKDEVNQFVLGLTKTLLNLRLLQFCVTDLSAGNVMIDSVKKIRIIDSDGNEFCCYPGGAYTVPYGHPDLALENANQRLRLREYADFAYAVMLYQCLMETFHPLQQKGFEDSGEQSDWKKYKFPFANDRQGDGVVADGASVGEKRLSRWKQLTPAVRQNFVDAFTFTNSDVPNIGLWIIALDSLIHFL